MITAVKPEAGVNRLKVHEIFYSLQGESRSVGWPTVFIRLTGCPLRCQYCDTEYAFTGGEWMMLDEILSTVSQYQARHVTVTGGEPLAQKACPKLLSLLADENLQVSLETSGALDISGLDSRTIIVMDIKTPGSGETERNLWSNLDQLTPGDQIKLVICDRNDYDWCKQIIKEHELTARFEVLLSPSHEEINASDLADWILADQLNVRFQTQLHKQLWGDEPGK